MTIEATCHECNVAWNVEEKHAGYPGKCPQCGSQVEVPGIPDENGIPLRRGEAAILTDRCFVSRETLPASFPRWKGSKQRTLCITSKRVVFLQSSFAATRWFLMGPFAVLGAHLKYGLVGGFKHLSMFGTGIPDVAHYVELPSIAEIVMTEERYFYVVALKLTSGSYVWLALPKPPLKKRQETIQSVRQKWVHEIIRVLEKNSSVGMTQAGPGHWVAEHSDNHANKINTTCPSCGQHLRAPAKAAGQKLACPRCKTMILVKMQKWRSYIQMQFVGRTRTHVAKRKGH